jgi:AcrR family transcriptional regulator
MAVKENETSVGRERLLDCAETLFAERGYSAVSIRDIAQATGLSHGAIYHHFDGKEDLYCQMIEGAVVRMTEVLRRAAEDRGNESTRERMERLCRAYITLSDQKRGLFERLMRDLAQLKDERAKDLMPRAMQALLDVFESVLADGITRHDIQDAGTRIAAEALLGMINALFSPQFTDTSTSDTRLKFIVEVFFEGITV